MTEGHMEFKLRRDNEPDIAFRGEMIANVTSCTPSELAAPKRWTEIRIYRTYGGKLVAEEVGMTTKPGEIERHTVTVCSSEDELVESLGHGWLAKLAYGQAGIEVIERID